tara:strand:+ start:380 stop:490 length:111 start_codon:yes stop_codon:yes gene_type:complete
MPVSAAIFLVFYRIELKVFYVSGWHSDPVALGLKLS